MGHNNLVELASPATADLDQDGASENAPATSYPRRLEFVAVYTIVDQRIMPPWRIPFNGAQALDELLAIHYGLRGFSMFDIYRRSATLGIAPDLRVEPKEIDVKDEDFIAYMLEHHPDRYR